MSLLHPETSTPGKLAGPLLAAGAAIVLVGAGLALGYQHTPAPAGDPCGVPSGVQVGQLDARDASLVTRRLLACSDLRFGRITAEDYRSAIAALDKQWQTPPPRPAPAIVWASTVRGFSSQYTTTSWSAQQALGAPNVFPASGDNASAWASLTADGQDEWLEVGFDNAGAVAGVDVYETYNPGAIARVELITQSGRIIETQPYGLAPSVGSVVRHMSVACTSEPIVAARVHVASTKVAGWNEIDAIGLVPCQR